MDCDAEWFLYFVTILTLQGLLPHTSANTLDITPEYIHMAKTVGSKVLCQARDNKRAPLPLAACQFFFFFAHNDHKSPIYDLTNGSSSILEDGYKYYGTGLQIGQCGIEIGKPSTTYLSILSCRVRTAEGRWLYKKMEINTFGGTSLQYNLAPQEVVALPGANVTYSGTADRALSHCYFYLGSNYSIPVSFNAGPNSGRTSAYQYYGAGLNLAQCGITLFNVNNKDNGFIVTTVYQTGSYNRRTAATLIVATAPSGISLRPTYFLALNEGDLLNATCTATKSRPVANITWLLGDRVVRQDMTNEEPHEAEWLWSHDLQTITQHLSLRVRREDNGNRLICRVGHVAWPPGTDKVVSEVVLIKFSPDAVVIRQAPPVLRLGTPATLTCESGSSNPTTSLSWYREGVPLPSSTTFTTPGIHGGQVAFNNFTLDITAQMNGAVYSCRADNTLLGKSSFKSVTLEFLFEPVYESHPELQQTGIEGRAFVFVAKAIANPPEVTYAWTKDGENLGEHDGGPILNITRLSQNDSGVHVCHANNSVGSASLQFNLTVMAPPAFTNLHAISTLNEGDILNATCTATKSRPVANITWLLGDRVVRQDMTNEEPHEAEWLRSHGIQTITQHLSLRVRREDNGNRLICRVEHVAWPSGTDKVVSEVIQVNFPPDAVVIRQAPPVLRLGTPATLTCESGSSNPAASLSWHREGVPLRSSTTFTTPGLHGGQVASNNLTLDITAQMNRADYSCRADNTQLGKSSYNSVTLEFQYEPVFESHTELQQTGIKGQAFALAVKATANPPEVTYSWTKDGASLAEHDGGPILNITRLSQKDSGVYVCHANNSVGSASLQFELTVTDIGMSLSHLLLAAGFTLTALLLGLAIIVYLRVARRCCWADVQGTMVHENENYKMRERQEMEPIIS